MARDYLNGDHSFKRWFKIMWKNGYVFLFLVSLALIIISIFFKEVLAFEPDNHANWVVAGLGFVIFSVVTYKGFWQFSNFLKGLKKYVKKS